MILRKFILLFVVLFFIPSCVSYKKSLEQKRSYLLEHEKFRYDLPKVTREAKTPNFPEIKYAELENGLKIYVVENKALPIAALKFIFKNGSAQDPQNKFGLINLTTKMLKESTQNRSSLKLAEDFATLGTEVSVGTGKDSSYISASLLSNNLDKAFELMSDMVVNPKFAQTDFDRVKLEHASGILAKQGNPAYIAQVSLLKTAYGYSHPYGHPLQGTLKSVKSFEIQDVKQAYESNFGPNNGAIIAVGDVSLENIKKLAQNYFANWRISSWQTPENPKITKSTNMKTVIIDRKNSPQTMLLLGRVGIDAKDPDLPALQILQQVLTGGTTSRLNFILRETKGWTYGVNAWANPLLFRGPMGINTSIQVPYGSDALKEILDQLELLKTKLINKDELNMAANTLSNAFFKRYNTVNQTAAVLASYFVYNLELDRDKKLYESIKKVTQQSVQRVAQRFFQKDQFVAIAVGERETMEIPLTGMNVGTVMVEQEEGQSSAQ